MALTQTYGVYEGYPPATQPICNNRSEQIASGGFQYIINYESIECTPAQLEAWLTHLAAKGLKVFLGVHDPTFYESGGNSTTKYTTMANALGATTSSQFITDIIHTFDSYSAVAGYYIGDEVSSSNYTAFTTYGSLVASLTSKPRLCIMGGLNGDPTTSLNGVESGTDILGLDFYPFGDDGLPYSEFIPNITALQTVCHTNSKQLALALQSFSWQEYAPPNRCSSGAGWPACAAFPTKANQQQQLADALSTLTTVAPSYIFYYSYFDMVNWTNAKYSGYGAANAAWTQLCSVLI